MLTFGGLARKGRVPKHLVGVAGTAWAEFADYQATGINDEATILQALTDAGADGEVWILPGTYNIDANLTWGEGLLSGVETGTPFGGALRGTILNLTGNYTVKIGDYASLQNLAVQAPAGFIGTAVTVESKGLAPITLPLDDRLKIYDKLSIYCPDRTGTALSIEAQNRGISLCTFGDVSTHGFEYGMSIHAIDGASQVSFINGNTFGDIIIHNSDKGFYMRGDGQGAFFTAEVHGNLFKNLAVHWTAGATEALRCSGWSGDNHFANVQLWDWLSTSMVLEASGSYVSRGYFYGVFAGGYTNNQIGTVVESISVRDDGTPLRRGDYDDSSQENLLADGDANLRDSTFFWYGNGANIYTDTGIFEIGSASYRVECNGTWSRSRQNVTDYARYQGREVTFGAWVRCAAANDKEQRLLVEDNVALSVSSVIPKDNTFHWTTVTHTVDAAATILTAGLYANYSGVADVDDISYISGAILVEGAYAPAYSFRPSRHITKKTFTVNAFQYPNPGTDWTPQIDGAYLGGSLAAMKCWLPLNFLKQGDYIIEIALVGDITQATGATLDGKLVRVNKANPLTTTDLVAIPQQSGDANFDIGATVPSPELVATDKQYAIEILGTTGAGDSITVMGGEIIIARLG